MEEAVLSKLGDPNIRASQLRLHDFRVEVTKPFGQFPLFGCGIGTGQIQVKIGHGRLRLISFP